MFHHVKVLVSWPILIKEPVMARHGVNYESVKHSALKLLSQGISPSVQKIRELLGTGSNTTIADHLKHWREEQGSKSIHHLPSNLPKELIATFDVLWQTAVEHAEQQLSAIKQDLKDRESKLQQDQLLNSRIVDDLKSQLRTVDQQKDNQQLQMQTLQTQLAVAEERLSEQVKTGDILKKQHETRLNNILDEKHQILENVSNLQLELTQCQKQLSVQTEQHQTILSNERKAQEHSEIRWAKLIDQARIEASQLRKNYEGAIQKQTKKIELLQNTHLELQGKLSTQKSDLKNKDGLIVKLETRLELLQSEHTVAVSAAAKFQEKVDGLIINNFNRGKVEI
jgi:chromosome segregation ATPase